MSEQQRRELKLVLLKALNKNQILILSYIDGKRNITYLLNSLTKESDVPLSTLTSCTKVLKGLSLISFRNGCPVELTVTGKLVCDILGCDMYAKE